MKPIPLKLRNEIASNPYMKKCCLCGTSSGKIDWHHQIIYAGSQLNEKWAILPLCEICHDSARNSKVKEKLNWIALNRATKEELSRISKAIDYIKERDRLNKVYK